MKNQLQAMFAGLLIFGILTIGFGGIFAVVGWYGLDEVRPYDDGVTATADVVGLVEGTVLIDGIVRRNFSPVYEFDALDGERYRITDHRTASTRPVAVGSTVEVSYQPEDPLSVRRIDDDRGWLRWFVIGGTAVAALGAIIVLGSLVGLIRRRTSGNLRPNHLP